MSLVTYSVCPGCSSAAIKPALTAKDYTVSRKEFDIWQCHDCSLRFTQNAPDALSIAEYYKSENYISHSDTKKGLVNYLYHRIRKRTLNSKRKLVEKYSGLQEGSLLDIGAGTGAFAFHMQQHHWKVTAIEPDRAARERARALYEFNEEGQDALWHLEKDSFDAISLWHVLEHVDDLHGYMQQVSKLLKKGGCLFIAVPNYTSFDATYYKSWWAAYDVPRHRYHFSPSAMRTLLRQHHLKLKSIAPMWFDSFYISMLSEKYKTGADHYLQALVAGVRSNVKAMINKERCSSLIYIIEKEDTAFS